MARVEVDTGIDYAQLEKDLAGVQRRIRNLQAKIERDQIRLGFDSSEMAELGARLDEAKAKLEHLRTLQANPHALSIDEAATLPERIAEAEAEVNILQRQFDKSADAVDRLNGNLDMSKAELDDLTSRESEMAGAIRETTVQQEEFTAETRRSTGAFEKLTNRIVRLAKRVLFFSLITMMLRHVRSYLGNLIKENEQAAQAVGRVKGAFQALAQPLMGLVMPIMTAVLNVITKIVNVILTLISLLTGKTVDSFAKAAKAAKGAGSAAGKAAKQFASFDTVQKLGDSGGGGGGGAASGIEAIFDGLKEVDLPDWLENLLTGVQVKIGEIEFDWSKGIVSKDAVIAGLMGCIGAALGGMFFGLPGAVFGMAIGTVLGLSIDNWLDKQENPQGAKDLLIVLLGTMLGAILGGMFGGFAGGVLGAFLGMALSVGWITFNKGKDFDKGASAAIFKVVLTSMLGLILGAKFGGVVGGVIGLTLGMMIGFGMVAFDENQDAKVRSAAKKAFFVALTAILGAVIGAAIGGAAILSFAGLAGGVIGLTLALAITFTLSKVDMTAIAKAQEKADAYAMGLISSPFDDLPANKKKVYGGSNIKIKATGAANGAVIPPNREFLAVLGDQKSGMNIETPLDTMVQAFRMAGGGRPTVNIKFTGSLSEVARLLKPEIDMAGVDLGASLGG